MTWTIENEIVRCVLLTGGAYLKLKALEEKENANARK